VTVEKAMKYAADKNIDFYIETSAKTSHNVQEAFTMIARMLYRKHRTKIV
jgi:hypothetical protein